MKRGSTACGAAGSVLSDADGSAVSDVDGKPMRDIYRVRLDGQWSRARRACHGTESDWPDHGWPIRGYLGLTCAASFRRMT